MSAQGPGWFPDQQVPGQYRWWDGTQWTEQVTPAPSVSTMPPPAPQEEKAKRKVPVPLWVVLWVLGGIVGILISILLSPVFMIISLAVLVTGIVALAKKTPTWLRLRSRKVAWTVTAAAAVMLVATSSITSALMPHAIEPVAAEVATPSATPEPEATPTVTAEPVDDEITDETFEGEASTVANTSATADQTALAVLATLEVKGRAPKTGYDRDEFGQRWLDVDRNGCDTRNDTLARDLTDVLKSGSCKVMSGVLADPFTGTTIDFERGQDTSALVQIDHVVALSDAWQKGAQQLTADQRTSLANDPLNLLAVDGSSNAQKGDGDAATWLPKNKAFRCAYVARQVSVKATYGLWVTQAEHDAIARVLADCPDEPALTSAYAAQPPAPAPEPVVEPAPAPAPAQPAPAPAPVQPAPAPAPAQPAPPTNVYYQNCDAVRAAGAAPIHAGDPGYTRKLDRDGDGTACE